MSGRDDECGGNQYNLNRVVVDRVIDASLKAKLQANRRKARPFILLIFPSFLIPTSCPSSLFSINKRDDAKPKRVETRCKTLVQILSSLHRPPSTRHQSGMADVLPVHVHEQEQEEQEQEEQEQQEAVKQ